MADNREFWLPSEFLTADDILMDRESFSKNGRNTAYGSNFGFPSLFPCDFGSSSSALSSPVESVAGSTETESSDEDDLFLAGLTRHLARSAVYEKSQRIASAPLKLEKPWVLSRSPQSTLSGAVGSWPCRSTTVSSNGSPNGPSPPTTPLGGNDAAWDLIYAAAGQVARLKLNSGEGPPNGQGLLGPPWGLTPVKHPSPPTKNPNTGGFYSNHCLSHANHFEHARHEHEQVLLKQQTSSIWGRPTTATREDLFSYQNQAPIMSQNRGSVVGEGNSIGRCGRPLGLPQSAWPPLTQNQAAESGGSAMRAVFLGGSGVKRECAGTGVFLPRRYGPNPSEPRKKSGCSTALLPARVVQALNKNLDHRAQAQAQAQGRFDSALIPDYDLLMARRNALLAQRMAQQKRSGLLRPDGGMSHELCLPQEWTY